MEKSQNPTHLYHGTPNEIHESDRPYLDAPTNGGNDECDPDTSSVFATHDLLLGTLFAFKNSNCKSILITKDGPAIVFKDAPANRDAMGNIYKIPAKGFKRLNRRNAPTAIWAIPRDDMPHVRDANGNEIPAIVIGDPIAKPTIRGIVEKANLRVYVLRTDVVDAQTYDEACRDAIYEGMESVFLAEAQEAGWIYDVTDLYK